jgi:hypothetical protein
MPDIAEMASYEMLCEDWGSAYLITRAPAARHDEDTVTGRPVRADS